MSNIQTYFTLGYTKPFTHLHPSPLTFQSLLLTSTYLHPLSNYFYLPPPTSPQLSIVSTHFCLPPLTLGMSFCQSFLFHLFLALFFSGGQLYKNYEAPTKQNSSRLFYSPLLIFLSHTTSLILRARTVF